MRAKLRFASTGHENATHNKNYLNWSINSNINKTQTTTLFVNGLYIGVTRGESESSMSTEFENKMIHMSDVDTIQSLEPAHIYISIEYTIQPHLNI